MPTHDAVFTESEGTILRSGSEVSETVNYDGETTSAGLWNYNNPDWLNIGREGYHANAATAWNTEPDGSGKSYDHNRVYPASELCDASSSDCTLTVYVNWTINYAFVRQHLNGGQLTTPRHEKVSVNENSLATYNNSLNLRSIPYGSAADSWNWNNTEWLNIKRDGYICKLGEEWSQNPDGTGKTYNHSVNYTAMDYCDCTYKNCTAVIYANWIPA